MSAQRQQTGELIRINASMYGLMFAIALVHRKLVLRIRPTLRAG